MKNSKILMILVVIVGVLLAVLARNQEKDEWENTEEMMAEYSGDETKILLYFSDASRSKLMQEYRYVSLADIRKNMVETILNELIQGPDSSELAATIPVGTKVNEVLQEENKVIVDFSEEFWEASDDQNLALQRIYSVVNSLTEIKEVEEVEIRVNGEMVADEKRI